VVYLHAGRAERPPKTNQRLHQIPALIKRSDSITIESKGMRVFVNVIRTFCYEDTPDGVAKGRNGHRRIVSSPPVALSLTNPSGAARGTSSTFLTCLRQLSHYHFRFFFFFFFFL
jgi:hypothetical protein